MNFFDPAKNKRIAIVSPIIAALIAGTYYIAMKSDFDADIGHFARGSVPFIICVVLSVLSGAVAVLSYYSAKKYDLERSDNVPPTYVFGEKYGLRDSSLTALLIGFVSVTPAVTMIKDMDSRGKTMNAAFIVCAASTLASHLGFTLSVEPDMMTPLLLTKLIGGTAAAVIAFFVCGKSEKVK